ncbi:MAG: DUF726 domain-containing protein [Phycisphaerales bacterium]|nr:DUF726 domain-containing protein [Phycisphaerales bacterium]
MREQYRRFTLMIIGTGALFALTGCGATSFGAAAGHGITFYCPGAGNIDFGDAGIRKGLKAAGYEGQVATVMWTVSFNPAIDQALRINARLGGTRLANEIKSYKRQFPDGPVTLIGLSAGTGVALWALEDLPHGMMVENVVLLGSSLNNRYNIGKSLPHIKGKIYNFYSSNDAILAGPMLVFGTIDGQFGVEGAGAVGLHPPTGADRVVNIPWKPEYSSYGYNGGHTDSTSPRFVQQFISPYVESEVTAGLPTNVRHQTTFASARD